MNRPIKAVAAALLCLLLIGAAAPRPAPRAQPNPGAAPRMVNVGPAAESAFASKESEAAEGGVGKREWLGQIFGWGMVPLWICSVVLLALILDRRRALKPARIVDPWMFERVEELVGRLQMEEAQEMAERSETVVGQAWAQGIHEFTLGGLGLAEALTNATALAFKPLRHRLGAIATIGVISPLLGLLGTVLGMIITFGQIAATGGADKSELAGGIGLALFTTAGGLIVAIPAILSNRYFVGRIGALAEQVEEAISRVNYRYSHAMAKSAPQSEPEPQEVET